MGRVGIYEMFTFSPEIKRHITGDYDMSSLRAQAQKEGMKPLRLSGANKVANGVTTIEEVMRVAPPPIET